MRCQIAAMWNLRCEKPNVSTSWLTFSRTYRMVSMFSGKFRGFQKRLELRCVFDTNVNQNQWIYWNSIFVMLVTWNLVSLGAPWEKLQYPSTWPKAIWKTQYFLKKIDSRFSEMIGESIEPWLFQWILRTVDVIFPQTSVTRRGSYLFSNIIAPVIQECR